MQLGDARLGDAEHLADLAQGEVLVVVEGDDQLLALGQRGDRLGQAVLDLTAGQRLLRVLGARVGDRVEQRDLVAGGVRDGPELVERVDGGVGDLQQRGLQFVLADLEPGGELGLARRPLQLVLELGLRGLDFTGARADRARHPVERAQLVDDRAADPGHREGLELDPPLGLEALDRADQAHQAVGDQVGVIDVRGQPGAEAAGDELDHRRVGDDQALARARVAFLLVAAPKIAQLHLFYAGFHRIRPAF